jgi:3-hydroxybutyryl-CoA dehydrogenase
MISSIESICVCGAGTMGAGIAQVTAMAGYSTILYDVNHTKLQTAENAIDSNLRSQVDKGKIGNNIREDCLSHLRYTSELNDCIADIFIEAIVEKPEAKIGLFNQLNEINHSEVIFATNTSSLSVSAIAEQVMHPDRVVGLHFFNPAPVMKLVEVVKTPFTNTMVLDTALAFVNTINKTAALQGCARLYCKPCSAALLPGST